jgi:hypothetical protein
MKRDGRRVTAPLVVRRFLPPLQRAALVCGWVGVAGGGWPAGPGAVHAVEPKPTSAYARDEIDGFTILVSDELRERPDVLADVRAELARQIGAIRRTMPRGPLEAVEQVPIWVEWCAKERGGAEFHPSAEWLRTHGYNPEKAGCIEIANARNFVAWSRTHQPCMLLHELAHAYHFRVLGHRHAGIEAAYERAVAAGRYDDVRHVAGGTRPAYAKTNDKEYFAELSEAYFGRNDFAPFDRAGLEMHDLEGYAVLREVWGEPRDASPVTPPRP